eukprot:TRINITY_DN1161_c0_g1_i1.p1 TRINITY_DN1161_c0_g1~~TRINITY_DN1161_c0_g1_i1.p1  ORF type:complete len:662 (+),score=114.91 TRINITY_DN1161_c0_g1_i1:168-2153(+)
MISKLRLLAASLGSAIGNNTNSGGATGVPDKVPAVQTPKQDGQRQAALPDAIDFLEQLLDYMQRQLEVAAHQREKPGQRQQLQPSFALSAAVIVRLEAYMSQFLGHQRQHHHVTSAVRSTSAATSQLHSQQQLQSAYRNQLLGQLHHSVRAVTRLRIVSGHSPLPLSTSIHLATFPALQYLHITGISASQLQDLCSLRLQLRLLSVDHCANVGLAALLLPHHAHDGATNNTSAAYTDGWGAELTELGMSTGQLPEGIAAWTKLEVLQLRSCGVSATDPSLRLLPAVRHLDLSFNLIEDLDFFQDCIKLDHLDLSHNGISCLVDVHLTLGNVHTLLLGSNAIRTTEGLERLLALEVLDLEHNRIFDDEDVARLGLLPCLAHLTLSGNPVARQKRYRRKVMTLLLQGGMHALADAEFTLDSKAVSGIERAALAKQRRPLIKLQSAAASSHTLCSMPAREMRPNTHDTPAYGVQESHAQLRHHRPDASQSDIHVRGPGRHFFNLARIANPPSKPSTTAGSRSSGECASSNSLGGLCLCAGSSGRDGTLTAQQQASEGNAGSESWSSRDDLHSSDWPSSDSEHNRLCSDVGSEGADLHSGDGDERAVEHLNWAPPKTEPHRAVGGTATGLVAGAISSSSSSSSSRGGSGPCDIGAHSVAMPLSKQ